MKIQVYHKLSGNKTLQLKLGLETFFYKGLNVHISLFCFFHERLEFFRNCKFPWIDVNIDGNDSSQIFRIKSQLDIIHLSHLYTSENNRCTDIEPSRTTPKKHHQHLLR